MLLLSKPKLQQLGLNVVSQYTPLIDIAKATFFYISAGLGKKGSFFRLTFDVFLPSDFCPLLSAFWVFSASSMTITLLFVKIYKKRYIPFIVSRINRASFKIFSKIKQSAISDWLRATD